MALIDRLIRRQRRDLARLTNQALVENLNVVDAAISSTVSELRRVRGGSWGSQMAMLTLSRLRVGYIALAEELARRTGERVKPIAAKAVDHSARFFRRMDREILGEPLTLRFTASGWLDRTAEAVAESRLRQIKTSFARYGEESVRKIEFIVARQMTLGRSWTGALDEVEHAMRHVAQGLQWKVLRTTITETSAAYNGTILETLREEDEPDDQVYKRLVATFDRRTGRDSMLLHGQTKPINEPFYDSFRGREYMHPPNRPNDREIIVGWRARWGVAEARRVDIETTKVRLPTRQSDQATAPGAARQMSASRLRPGVVLDRGRKRVLDVTTDGGMIVVTVEDGRRREFSPADMVPILLS